MWQLHVVRLQVFTVVMIQAAVFWIVALCSYVVRQQCFRIPCCLHFKMGLLDGDSMILWNAGILPHHSMLSQPRRLWPEGQLLASSLGTNPHIIFFTYVLCKFAFLYSHDAHLLQTDINFLVSFILSISGSTFVAKMSTICS